VKVRHGHTVTQGRFVGTLITYAGLVEGEIVSNIKRQPGAVASLIVRDIEWRGRLFMDSKIASHTAYRETEKYVRNFTPECTYIMGHNPAAFLVREGERVALVGVHPVAVGCGLARILVRHMAAELQCPIYAGTYEHNLPAQAMYRNLGMQEIRREDVYHED